MAFFTGVAIDESITGVAIPAALAEIAVFMKETISESAEVAEPPQTGVGHAEQRRRVGVPVLRRGEELRSCRRGC